MSYEIFLETHKALADQNNNIVWDGRVYLPPCTCFSQISCKESKNTKVYDFEKFTDIDVSGLINMCHFCDNASSSYSKQSMILCKKYSPHELTPLLHQINCNKERVEMIKSSPIFQAKLNLLFEDLKLLFPLNGSKFIMKKRYTKTLLKFQIMCSYATCYDMRSKHAASTSARSRNCTTTKAINRETTCNFSMSVFLNTQTLDWYMKWPGNKIHTHHLPTLLNYTSIGQFQLSRSMIDEVNKLHCSNVSSAIQQNVLMMNNNITVPIMTLLNNQYQAKRQIESTKTDFEELIDLLKSKSNITYFIMDASSPKTPLLTIKKTRKSANATTNNTILANILQNNEHDQRHVLPHLDSTQQQILKQLFVRNKDTQKVNVILAVGWSRDEDLCSLYKYPEVLKMDCTFKTNREGRPLFSIVARDSNHKLFTVFRCLLPSEKKAIFHTLLVNVIPKILGPTTCSRINVCITDGDSQEIKACQNACRLVFKNAIHINCFWHMIHNSVSRSKIIYHPDLKHVLRHWLYFTATKCETKKEMQQSHKYMIVSTHIRFIYIFIHIINILL